MICRTAAWIPTLAIGLLALLAPLCAGAEGPKTAPQAAGTDAALSADLVKTGLYLITGGGSNSLLRLSASGSILVDGKLPGHYRPLMSQLRRISRLSDLPARVLIVTDHHLHHSGNHAQFAAAGIAVLVQENGKRRLPQVNANAGASAGPGAASNAKPPAPIVTFDRDYPLRMGGVEVQLFHFGNAHTDNDAVVHFPDLKVIAVGDLLSPQAPSPDFAAGGSLVGWSAVLEQVLKLDFELVVPSVGPVASRADLQAFKTRLDTLVARASVLVSQGVGKDQLPARIQTDDLGWQLRFDPDQWERFYAELASRR